MSKPGKVLRKLCKKLGVRLTVKRGKKRVYKSVVVLKRQCAKEKVKKRKRRKRRFGMSGIGVIGTFHQQNALRAKERVDKAFNIPGLRRNITTNMGQMKKNIVIEELEKLIKQRNKSTERIRTLLSKFPIRGRSLRKVITDGVILYETDLRDANLQHERFARAKLIRAKLQGANLQGAHLRGANLDSAYLQGANLKGANLQQAELFAARLQKANLKGAYLFQADLEMAHLHGANLQGAHLQGANLDSADLQGANLIGVDLRATWLRDAKYDSQTQFDPGFDPEVHEMVLVPEWVDPDSNPFEVQEDGTYISFYGKKRKKRKK